MNAAAFSGPTAPAHEGGVDRAQMGAGRVTEIVRRMEAEFVPATAAEGFDDVLRCETEAKVAAALRAVAAEGNAIVAGAVAQQAAAPADATATAVASPQLLPRPGSPRLQAAAPLPPPPPPKKYPGNNDRSDR